ncbi:MAG: hypothetical protein ABNH53_14575 [Henriciella sp.]
MKSSDIDIRRDTETVGGSIRIALFSDTHFEIFKNTISMQRIVDRINQE